MNIKNVVTLVNFEFGLLAQRFRHRAKNLLIVNYNFINHLMRKINISISTEA